MITNIGTVAVYVDDQQRAKEFWTKKVGFELVTENPMGPNIYWIEVAPKNNQTRIVLYPKAIMQGSESMKASIVFDCENIMETYKTMMKNGVEFKGEPNEMPFGTFVQFIDEEGNEFLLKG